MGWSSSWQLRCCLPLVCVMFTWGADSDVLQGEIHTIVSSECTAYFSFQMLALVFTHKRVGQTGPLTRIMACSEEDLKMFNTEDMEVMNTHVTPQYRYDPETGDMYTPYNRPGGVLHWLENAKPREEWILMVDPDMLFRHPVTPGAMYIKEGWARATRYSLLKGIRNDMALKHIPEVEPRNDTLGGPPGRRADEAGAFYYLRTKDLGKVAPLWMNYTKAVRADSEAWYLSGQSKPQPGVPVWISEMYGWVYSAAKANVWHILDPVVQVYPGRTVSASPSLIHYGTPHKVLDYVFNKHNHFQFNHTRCPPWNLQPTRKPEEDAGLIPHPPSPKNVVENDLETRYGLMLRIEAVNTINEALCKRHRTMCQISDELLRECGRVANMKVALKEEFENLDKVICRNSNPAFCSDKTEADCINSWLDMGSNCTQFCGLCTDYIHNKHNLESSRLGTLSRLNCALHSGKMLLLIALVMLVIVLMIYIASPFKQQQHYNHSYKEYKSAV